jgi:coatomer subunit beta
VRFEAAATLLHLSAAPSAIRAAASSYIDILVTEADNNVKLIVLDRIGAIKRRHPKVMQELLLDVLRALASPSLAIRRKTLQLALDLVSLKNIDEVVQVLKKEIARTQAKELEKQGEYRQMLIHAVHTCAVKFPDVASKVVHLLMEFLADENAASAYDVVLFVREVIETYGELRAEIVAKLVEQLEYVRAGKVQRAVLWIVGEYSEGTAELRAAYKAVQKALGAAPFVRADADDEPDSGEPRDDAATSSEPAKEHSGPKLNADGTYASQSALVPDASASAAPGASSSSSSAAAALAALPPLRANVVAGDFFLASVIGVVLTKLTLKLDAANELSTRDTNRVRGDTLLTLVGVLRLGRSSTPPHPIDRDSAARLYQCIRALTAPDAALLRDILLNQARISFKTMLRDMAEHNKRQSTLTGDDDAEQRTNSYSCCCYYYCCCYCY